MADAGDARPQTPQHLRLHPALANARAGDVEADINSAAKTRAIKINLDYIDTGRQRFGTAAAPNDELQNLKQQIL